MGIAGASLIKVQCIVTVTMTRAEIAGAFTEMKPAILRIYILRCQLHQLFTYYTNYER